MVVPVEAGKSRLVKVSAYSNGYVYVARMAYDGDGKRVKRVDNNGTIHYVGSHYERNVGTGLSPSDAVTKYYYAQTGKMKRLIALKKDTDFRYIVPDHLGGTLSVRDNQGGETGWTRYNSFGSDRDGGGTLSPDKKFTGQTLDGYINLYFMGARYYDQQLGRFISPDTIVPDPRNPQSLNRYAYGYNNPLKYTDPTGHAASDLRYKEPGWFDQQWHEQFVINNKREPKPVDYVYRFVTMGRQAGSGYSGTDIMQAVTIAIGAGLSESGPGLWSQPVDQTGPHLQFIDELQYGSGFTEYRWGKVRIVMATGGTKGDLVRVLNGGQGATTFGPNEIVFSLNRQLDLNQPAGMIYLMHELRHVMQAQELGGLFLPNYLWAGIGHDHRSNPFEQDANDFANGTGTGAPNLYD